MRFIMLLLPALSLISCNDIQTTSCTNNEKTNTCHPVATQPNANFKIIKETQTQIKVVSDLADQADEFQFEWYFDDQSHFDDRPSLDYLYSNLGTYNISLTVTNSEGISQTSTQTIEITNTKPIASIVVRYEPLKLTLDAQLSQDELPLTFIWKVGEEELTGQSVEYIFSESGDIEVELTATDYFGESDSITRTITVSDTPNIDPIAIIRVEQHNHLMNLIGSYSYDPDKDFLTYEWQLNGEVFSTEGKFYYEIPTAGEHNLTLSVFDGETYVQESEIINVTDTQRNDTDLLLYETSKEIIGKCTSCHDDGRLSISQATDLEILAQDLKNYIQISSATALINFPSETNGYKHSGYRFIAGQDRYVNPGALLSTHQQQIWSELITKLAEQTL